VNDDVSALPPATILAAIYPNPFNPRTVIAFELAETGPIELAIYDLGGRRVRIMESGTQSAGRHESTWDGQDNAGRAVPTGTYFCRLSTAQGSQTRKLTLAR
jgi:flagellar hook assembly protein FlgD